MEQPEKKNYKQIVIQYWKNFHNFFTSLREQSPTLDKTVFTFKCAAVGYFAGLFLLKKAYTPMIFGIGYGIGRSMNCTGTNCWLKNPEKH